MKISKLVVGYLEENCYILEKDNKCIVIDPGDNLDKIMDSIKGSVEEILITHYHFDHIGALNALKEKTHLEENVFLKKTFKYEVIDVPGHTSDSKAFYFYEDGIMFTGDFLFNNSIGRMDLPTGSKMDMINSIRKIEKYPLNTIIYPGHSDIGTLGKSVEIAKEILHL